jgi:hypothetical protein
MARNYSSTSMFLPFSFKAAQADRGYRRFRLEGWCRWIIDRLQWRKTRLLVFLGFQFACQYHGPMGQPIVFAGIISTSGVSAVGASGDVYRKMGRYYPFLTG